MEKPDEVKQLLADLRDFNKERRRRAVYRLGMIGGEQALRSLMIAVEDENEDLIVRGRAAQMLGVMRDTRAVLSLIMALDARGYQTPMYAAKALGVIGDHRAVGPLRDVAQNHTNESTRQAAWDALGSIARRENNPPNVAEPELEPIHEP